MGDSSYVHFSVKLALQTLQSSSLQTWACSAEFSWHPSSWWSSLVIMLTVPVLAVAFVYINKGNLAAFYKASHNGCKRVGAEASTSAASVLILSSTMIVSRSYQLFQSNFSSKTLWLAPTLLTEEITLRDFFFLHFLRLQWRQKQIIKW